MNGVQVTRHGNTIFVPLPKELWRLDRGPGCNCAFCNGRKSYWDTVAMMQNPIGGKWDTTWTVHYPKLTGSHLYRGAPPHKEINDGSQATSST